MKLEFSLQIFERNSITKFRQNPSSGSRVVSCRRRDVTKLIVNFRNFANAPKKEAIYQNQATEMHVFSPKQKEVLQRKILYEIQQRMKSRK
jgi:hypothetical protein